VAHHKLLHFAVLELLLLLATRASATCSWAALLLL
jgi:hypothetical protein